jgi:hypothetical protein
MRLLQGVVPNKTPMKVKPLTYTYAECFKTHVYV